MRKKPTLIKATATFLLGLPLFCTLLIGYKIHFDLKSVSQIISYSWAMLLTLGIGCWAAAYGIWKVTNWGYYLFYTFIAIVIGADLWQMNTQIDNNWYAVDFFFIALGAILYRSKKISEPYFNPQIRWWDPAKRFKCEIEATFIEKGSTFISKILDISESGFFTESAKQQQVGDIFNVKISYNSHHIQTLATVVRNSFNPQGTGYKFVTSSRSERRQVRLLLKALKSPAYTDLESIKVATDHHKSA